MHRQQEMDFSFFCMHFSEVPQELSFVVMRKITKMYYSCEQWLPTARNLPIAFSKNEPSIKPALVQCIVFVGLGRCTVT